MHRIANSAKRAATFKTERKTAARGPIAERESLEFIDIVDKDDFQDFNNESQVRETRFSQVNIRRGIYDYWIPRCSPLNREIKVSARDAT